MYWKRTIGENVAGSKGQLIFADALYFKTYEAFLKSLENFHSKDVKAKILKSLAICLLYGMADYALYLCDRAARDNMLSASEREIIFRQICKNKRCIRFRGQGRFARALWKMYLYLKPAYFYFADEGLGNE